ncbi:hypothetical protein P389DRAFT_196558 [Cystobasidium minutum MCA 4210]|uniref:uncharacterized protein n=1 Tax=Cystobasidium minutum MCA 4210 TaxID=1397322 RepID=UPI0034CED727|eukprot:jgi/Rhomi1/196558/gm1.4772_g
MVRHLIYLPRIVFSTPYPHPTILLLPSIPRFKESDRPAKASPSARLFPNLTQASLTFVLTRRLVARPYTSAEVDRITNDLATSAQERGGGGASGCFLADVRELNLERLEIYDRGTNQVLPLKYLGMSSSVEKIRVSWSDAYLDCGNEGTLASLLRHQTNLKEFTVRRGSHHSPSANGAFFVLNMQSDGPYASSRLKNDCTSLHDIFKGFQEHQTQFQSLRRLSLVHFSLAPELTSAGEKREMQIIYSWQSSCGRKYENLKKKGGNPNGH